MTTAGGSDKRNLGECPNEHSIWANTRNNMKLIRDNIHHFAEDKSKIFQLERMNELSLGEVLKDKLVEETQEVLEAKPEEMLEELADVYEVLLALGAVYGHTLQSIQAFADNKRNTLGGFRDRWFMRD